MLWRLILAALFALELCFFFLCFFSVLLPFFYGPVTIFAKIISIIWCSYIGYGFVWLMKNLLYILLWLLLLLLYYICGLCVKKWFICSRARSRCHAIKRPKQYYVLWVFKPQSLRQPASQERPEYFLFRLYGVKLPKCVFVVVVQNRQIYHSLINLLIWARQ